MQNVKIPVLKNAPKEYTVFDVFGFGSAQATELRDNTIFTAEGKLYPAYDNKFNLIFNEDNNDVYVHFFISELMLLIENFGFPKGGKVFGKWSFVKRGSVIGVHLEELL